jgi:hypothetical protein
MKPALRNAIKKTSSTLLTLSVLSNKTFDTLIPTLIAAEINPTFCFHALVATVGMTTLVAPINTEKDGAWLKKFKLLDIIPWGILVAGVYLIQPELYPAAWFLTSFGLDYALKLIDAFINRLSTERQEVIDLILEGIKRCLTASLILVDGKPGSAISKVIAHEPISKNQFRIAIGTTISGAICLSYSTKNAIMSLFNKKSAAIAANDDLEQGVELQNSTDRATSNSTSQDVIIACPQSYQLSVVRGGI